MTIEWTTWHWIVGAILLAMQAVGLGLTSMRAPGVSPGWFNFGVLAIRHDAFALVMFVPYVLGACMATTIIVIRLFEALARQS